MVEILYFREGLNFRRVYRILAGGGVGFAPPLGLKNAAIPY